MKFQLPDDPNPVWRESLRRIAQAEIDVGLQAAKLDLEIAEIEMRQANGEELLGERNALKKKELEVRMMELCLKYQKGKLKEALEK